MKNYFCFFTDGATEPTNPGPSGYAFIETKGFHDKHELNSFSKFIGNKTNNIAEICAIEAVFDFILSNPNKYLSKYDTVIDIFSDSDYAIKCITVWYDKWVKTGKLSDKKNIALISHTVNKYKKVKSIVTVNIQWVKGHSGVFGYERCDELAGLAIKNQSEIIVETEIDKNDITIDDRIDYLMNIHSNKDTYESESIRILIDYYKDSIL